MPLVLVFRMQMLLLLVATVLRAAPVKPAGETLRLEDAMRHAVSAAKVGEARLELARSNLQYMEALNRWRFELRPSLGMFAFSNPALLAMNLGGGLLFNRRTATAPGLVDNARFDALTAEMNQESLKVRVQLETARVYFDVLGKQQVAQLASESLELRRTRGAEVERSLAASRITALEKLAYQQDLLELETAWLNAETERKAAAVRLALLCGMPESAGTLRVADVDVAALPGGAAVPGVDSLVTVAMQHRSESKLMREKLEAIEKTGTRHPRAVLETAGGGYSYIGNRTGVGNLLQSVLGGNTGRGEVVVNIPLRDTGEKAAHEALSAARVRLLRLELTALEDSVRVELAQLRDLAGSSVERLRLASKKLELARKSAEVTRAREQAGLASISSTWSADQALLAAESAYMAADYDRKSSLYALLVVCGVERLPETQEARALPR
jgi:outer membrane protein TolC